MLCPFDGKRELLFFKQGSQHIGAMLEQQIDIRQTFRCLDQRRRATAGRIDRKVFFLKIIAEQRNQAAKISADCDHVRPAAPSDMGHHLRDEVDKHAGKLKARNLAEQGIQALPRIIALVLQKQGVKLRRHPKFGQPHGNHHKKNQNQTCPYSACLISKKCFFI